MRCNCDTCWRNRGARANRLEKMSEAIAEHSACAPMVKSSKRHRQIVSKLARPPPPPTGSNRPDDMAAPRWDLHPLKSNLETRWAILVKGNWRLTFMFDRQDVVLVDYLAPRPPCTTLPIPAKSYWEYLGEITVIAAADRLGVTRAALSRILNGSTGISADMALRLQDALGTSAEMWFGMRNQEELSVARKGKRPKITPLIEQAA